MRSNFLHGVSFKDIFLDYKNKFLKDDIFTGAAALAFYLFLSIFPAMIFLLSLLPFLPIQNLELSIMNFINQILPVEAALMFSGVVKEIMSSPNTSLISFGFVATIWAASSGMYAVMQQLNKTYEVTEARPFVKGRTQAIMLTFAFGILVVTAFSLIVFGGVFQKYLAEFVSHQGSLLFLFQILRWMIVVLFMFSGFSLIYHYGPNLKKKFKFITPGTVVGVSLLILASLGFQYFVENFSNYSRTYGSIGAVIILMVWLYIAGIILLFGSEVNALTDRYKVRETSLVL